MSNYVCDCKYCCFCFTKITFLNVQLSGECSYNHTDKCRCYHPAPPRDSTPGQIHQCMTDETDHTTSYRTVHSSQQSQYCILKTDVGVRNRARDRHKTSQHKEQSRADTDGYHSFDTVILFHIHFLPRIFAAAGSGFIRDLSNAIFLYSIRCFMEGCQLFSASYVRMISRLCYCLLRSRHHTARYTDQNTSRDSGY